MLIWSWGLDQAAGLQEESVTSGDQLGGAGKTRESAAHSCERHRSTAREQKTNERVARVTCMEAWILVYCLLSGGCLTYSTVRLTTTFTSRWTFIHKKFWSVKLSLFLCQKHPVARSLVQLLQIPLF